MALPELLWLLFTLTVLLSLRDVSPRLAVNSIPAGLVRARTGGGNIKSREEPRCRRKVNMLRAKVRILSRSRGGEKMLKMLDGYRVSSNVNKEKINHLNGGSDERTLGGKRHEA